MKVAFRGGGKKNASVKQENRSTKSLGAARDKLSSCERGRSVMKLGKSGGLPQPKGAAGRERQRRPQAPQGVGRVKRGKESAHCRKGVVERKW